VEDIVRQVKAFIENEKPNERGKTSTSTKRFGDVIQARRRKRQRKKVGRAVGEKESFLDDREYSYPWTW
jgi:ribosome assembly protein YihI (activator of Der GTPase)